MLSNISFALSSELILFSGLFSTFFLYALIRNRVYTEKVNALSKKMTLLLPLDLAAEFADVRFSDDVIIADDKYGTLSLIADKYDKGYDFIIVEQPEIGSVVPKHDHLRSKELFYVLEGEINICLDSTMKHDSDGKCKDSVNLKPHDWFFIKAKQEHSIQVMQPAKYIVIAKPPLFSRIGNFYEKHFKK
jgi:mannose-6-phosphate isomerase-like protein (cupin superfamily)